MHARLNPGSSYFIDLPAAECWRSVCQAKKATYEIAVSAQGSE